MRTAPSATAANAPILEVTGYSVAYGKIEAVRAVDLTVQQGTIAAIIGPNGAGKTTLLNALMGLIPGRGAARYDGMNLAPLSVEARVARGLCLVPERRELFAEMSVADNLLLGAFTRYAKDKSGVKRALDETYALFPRLRERAAQLAGTLSGGERQMLALGRALMTRPRLLMLDEPSLGLAPLIVEEILRTVQKLKQAGVSILLVEQNARAALAVADYGYVLETGNLVLQGPAAELARDEKVIQTYLGLSRRRT